MMAPLDPTPAMVGKERSKAPKEARAAATWQEEGEWDMGRGIGGGVGGGRGEVRVKRG